VTASSPPLAPPAQTPAPVAPAATAAAVSPTMARLIAVAGLSAVAVLYVYGSYGAPLSEPDEGRYAEIAREMLVRHDWVTPHLNFVKYFEKPPLVYWASAAAFTGFGISELAARLPVILSGLMTLVVTLWLAASMYGTTTALVVLPILGLGGLFAILAQWLTLDMPLTCFMTVAMSAVWFAWSQEFAADAPLRASGGSSAPHRARTWYRVAYVAVAVAVLIKGPVAALLVGGAVLPFLVMHGGWRAVRASLDWRSAGVALVVALPWFLLVSWRNPEFVHFFVIEQHVARYLWTHEHGAPIWFYVPLLPLALAPWSFVLLLDPPLLRGALAPRDWRPATRFLILWATVVVGFFSLSTSKLLTYILPAVPPLALLMARAIEDGLAQGRTAGLSRLGGLFVVVGPLASLSGAILPYTVAHWRMPLVAPYLIGGGAVLAASGWAVQRAVRSGRPYGAFAALAGGTFAILAVVVSGRGAANDYRALGLAARAAMQPDDRIAMYEHVVQGIPFYAARRVAMVGHSGELRFGSQQGDQSAFFWPSDDDLRREWARPDRLFLVINRSELAAIQPPLDPPPIPVAAKDKKLLVVNR
jgi:4-amino-4-deoxy-L-arabinose transferase-like glycosyltransferase